MAIRDNWRCFLWLPADRREATGALVMFALFLGLAPFGTKFGLAKADLVVGITYRPVAAIVLALLLALWNIQRTRNLALGDHICDARLRRVTLSTWAVLSVVTLIFSILAETVPALAPLQEPNVLNTVTSLALASQLPLAVTLGTSLVFRPSTNGANELRASKLGAREVLGALWQRREPGRHLEQGNDKVDWDRLVGFLKMIVAKGEDLPLKLKCPAEAEHAGQLVTNARLLSAEIDGQILPLRNKILDGKLGGAQTKPRDFFL